MDINIKLLTKICIIRAKQKQKIKRWLTFVKKN